MFYFMKIRTIFLIAITVLLVFNVEGVLAKDWSEGVYFSGKTKKNKPVGNGKLEISSDQNRVIISGVFTTLDNGATQATGTLSLEKKGFQWYDIARIDNVNLEFNIENLDTIQIKKGYPFDLRYVSFDNQDDEATDFIKTNNGIVESDEYIVLAPKTYEISYVGEMPRISFSNSKSGSKNYGYGYLGTLQYLIMEKDDYHFKQYKKKDFFGSDMTLVSFQDGESNWATFNPDNSLIASFSRLQGDKILSGEFDSFINGTDPWKGEVENMYIKYIGTFQNGNKIIKGEFKLPNPNLNGGYRNIPNFNDILVKNQPEFISIYKDTKDKIHKKLTLKKGGSLLSYIKPDEFMDVDSLTITGIMYGSDIKIINEMKGLEYLDLSSAFITYSPQEKEDNKFNREFENAFVKMMSNINESKRTDKSISTTQYGQNKLLLEILKNTKDVEPNSDPCFVPTINELPNLKTVILPTLAQWISKGSFSNCQNLETVILPEYLKSIRESCFQHCVKLKKLSFPKTLSYIYMGDHKNLPFFGCSSLEEIDFGKCALEDPDKWYRFPECKALKKFVYPNNTVEGKFSITNDLECEIFYPATLKTCSVSTLNSSQGKSKLHFVSKIPPRNGGVSPERSPILYIPQGSLTEYYSVFGNGFKYVEE